MKFFTTQPTGFLYHKERKEALDRIRDFMSNLQEDGDYAPIAECVEVLTEIVMALSERTEEGE